jgi:hypothetical protein
MGIPNWSVMAISNERKTKVLQSCVESRSTISSLPVVTNHFVCIRSIGNCSFNDKEFVSQ